MPAAIDAPANGRAAVENGRFHPAILDLEQMENRVEKSLVKKVRKLIEDFPDRALEVIRGWMAEGA